LFALLFRVLIIRQNNKSTTMNTMLKALPSDL